MNAVIELIGWLRRQEVGRGFQGQMCFAAAGIAKSEQIPQKFLESILLTLRKAGILGSKKGKHGGYYLRKTPSDIKMTEVMRVLEGPIAMVPCVSLNFYEKCDDCPDENLCSVHRLMVQVRDNTLYVLRSTTLEDLSGKKDV